MFKIFSLKTIDPSSGVVDTATFRQRIAWLLAGCPIRDRKVVDRFVEKKQKQKNEIVARAMQNSNTFSLPSS
tara:strand:- start:193 stop:408 length:216 start_codon:yes stop_codon:yes gene_type:complete